MGGDLSRGMVTLLLERPHAHAAQTCGCDRAADGQPSEVTGELCDRRPDRERASAPGWTGTVEAPRRAPPWTAAPQSLAVLAGFRVRRRAQARRPRCRERSVVTDRLCDLSRFHCKSLYRSGAHAW